MSRRVKVTGDWFHGQVPHGAVYVGRAAPGLRKSLYANPFKIGRDAVDAAEAKQLYRLHAEGFDVATLRRDLAGKDIACWCPLDQPCHADVLLELANPSPPPASQPTDSPAPYSTWPREAHAPTRPTRLAIYRMILD